MKDYLAANGVETKPISNHELKEKYMFNYCADMQGLLEPKGGILLANKCLQAVQVFTIWLRSTAISIITQKPVD